MMMKIIYTILSFFAVKANATNYYVSNAGNNNNNGTSVGTSWQTIGKVNGFSFTSGDSILFKRGDSWNEKLIVPTSNTNFGAYGTGVYPVITGFQTQGGFTNVGNVWTATATNAVDSLNTVIINGKLSIKARFPNSGYLTYTSGTDSTLITSLTGTPDYTGNEIVVRTNHWILDLSKVQTQSTGNLSIRPKLTYAATSGFGYFFQNSASFLDSANEYSIDPATKVLKVYSTTTPIVQMSSIDTLVQISQKGFISFSNIEFSGGNKSIIEIDTSHHITIQNCSIKNGGRYGICGAKSNHITIDADSIMDCLCGGIYLRRFDPYTPMQDTCKKATISNSYLKRLAIYAGMGLGNNERYLAIHINGDSTTIYNNKIDSGGYIGVRWNGRWSYLTNNEISNYAFIKDDGGGIHTFCKTYFPSYVDSGSYVRSNIIYNGIPSPLGISGVNSPCAGLYADNYTDRVYYDSNTVYNTYGANIFLNESTNCKIRWNVLDDSTGYNMLLNGLSDKSNNNTFLKNVYFQRSTSNSTIFHQSYVQGLSIAASDSNYFLRPSANNSTIIKLQGSSYGYPHLYTDNTGFDLNGGTMPGYVASNNAVIVINRSFQTADVALPSAATYIDVNGVFHRESINLSPFSSALLFLSTVSISQIFIPH